MDFYLGLALVLILYYSYYWYKGMRHDKARSDNQE